ncbi:PilW family protein [Acinetobacter modestus]|uniref:PilW family protein n=1 Tax=Acinetobacter modestus TaxID=1776740 RepID=UPI003209037C
MKKQGPLIKNKKLNNLEIYPCNKINQGGFTLIELMVALALGLIVSAAALQLFTSGIIGTRLQQASSEIQDSGVFGLEYIARDIRLANYGNINQPELNDQTPWGGVVLTSGSSGTNNFAIDLTGVASNSSGLSNVSGSSDQLTIQFLAPNDMLNCEGEDVKAGEYIIQRYFLRKDDNGVNATDYSLACDSNKKGVTSRPTKSSDISEFGGSNKGEIIMPRVDQLRFYLGTISGNNFTYYSIENYKKAATAARAATKQAPRIVSVKIAVLVRSKDDTKSEFVEPDKAIGFADTTVTPKDSKTKYLRREYSTVVALRNALGEKI